MKRNSKFSSALLTFVNSNSINIFISIWKQVLFTWTTFMSFINRFVDKFDVNRIAFKRIPQQVVYGQIEWSALTNIKGSVWIQSRWSCSKNHSMQVWEMKYGFVEILFALAAKRIPNLTPGSKFKKVPFTIYRTA